MLNIKVPSDSISPKNEIMLLLLCFYLIHVELQNLHMGVQHVHTKMTVLYLYVILIPTRHLYSDFCLWPYMGYYVCASRMHQLCPTKGTPRWGKLPIYPHDININLVPSINVFMHHIIIYCIYYILSEWTFSKDKTLSF